METVRLRVNGAERSITLEPRRTLLDALRTDLGLTGAKKACAHNAYKLPLARALVRRALESLAP